MSNPTAAKINPLQSMGRTSNIIAPPIKAARKWLDGMEFPADRPLIDVSQAAPTAPPPIEMRQAMADHVLSEGGRAFIRSHFGQYGFTRVAGG